MTEETVVPFMKPKQRKSGRPKADPPTWLSRCLVGPSGQPLPVLANALIALRSDPQISPCFGFDEMQDAAVLQASVDRAMGAGVQS